MIRQPLKKAPCDGFSIFQTMVAMGIMSTLLAAIYTSSTALLGSMKASENYSVGQLMAVDYLTLDLRRCQAYTFTTSSGTLTLPLTLQLPQYYAADGRRNDPQRSLVTSSNKHNKKDHKIFSARYYYHYGSLGSSVQVVYSLSNGILYRTEGSLPPRAVGRNIQRVTFGPSVAGIAADPVVNTTITFSPTQRSKQAPPPLASNTFMRGYYYSD